MFELQQYIFDVKYYRGRLNRVVDARDYLRYALSMARVASGIISSSVGSAKNPTITPTTPYGRENCTGMIGAVFSTRPISVKRLQTRSGKNVYRRPNKQLSMGRMHDHPAARHLSCGCTHE